jgi:hypothetical protein
MNKKKFIGRIGAPVIIAACLAGSHCALVSVGFCQKNSIDAIAKIVAAGGVLFGVWRGTQHLILSREQKVLELKESERVSKTEEAKFWLELRTRFNDHHTVHVMLRNGEWEKVEEKPWPELDAYLGLMEHCEIMICNELLDFKTFNDIYGYRVLNAVGYESIRDKLEKHKDSWTNFFSLYLRICKKRGQEPILSSPGVRANETERSDST